MIIFAPADLPKIEPDNWDVFWNIWNTHNKPLVKKVMNTQYSEAKLGDNSAWYGLDIYKGPYNIPVSYEAPYYDISKELPNLHKFLSTFDKLCLVARLSQSTYNIPSHTDNDADRWSLRAYFYYTSPAEQWYFTKPFDRHGKKTYINRSPDTNWFIYNDKHSWHGTDFDSNHKKILLQIYSLSNYSKLAEKSIEKYRTYTIDSESL